MQQQNDVWAFLLELYKRMGAKSPKFFQVVQAIGMFCALVTGIPLAIQQFEMFTNIHVQLPDIVNSTLIRIIFFCGVIVKLMAKLPVADSVKKQMTATDKKEVLPYTTKKE